LPLAKYALQIEKNHIKDVIEQLTSKDDSYRKKLEADIAASPKLQDPLWSRNANLRTVSWDLECTNRGKHFPDATQDAILSIGMIMKELVTGEERSLVLTYKIDKKKGIHDDNDPNDLKLKEADVIMLEDEEDM